jgi:iron complex transport system substrate-binding protein
MASTLVASRFALRLLPAVTALATLGLLSGFAMAQGAQPVSRIVTLAPSLTEAVCALGRCAQLVGTDRHSTWPGSVLALPKVGGLEDAQIERIVTLRPNMVLLGPRSRAGERLQALGVPVMTFDARTHADLKRMLLKLGDMLGEPARAAELVARMEAELDAAAGRMPAALRGRTVYVEVGAGSSAASEKSFIGETVARLGLVNVVSGDLGLFPTDQPRAAAAPPARPHHRPARHAGQRRGAARLECFARGAPAAAVPAGHRSHGPAVAPRPAPGRGRADAGGLPECLAAPLTFSTETTHLCKPEKSPPPSSPASWAAARPRCCATCWPTRRAAASRSSSTSSANSASTANCCAAAASAATRTAKKTASSMNWPTAACAAPCRKSSRP